MKRLLLVPALLLTLAPPAAAQPCTPVCTVAIQQEGNCSADVAICLDGNSESNFLAVAPNGNADSHFFAVSVFENSPGNSYGGVLAVSLEGNAEGVVAVSVFGNADGLVAASVARLLP